MMLEIRQIGSAAFDEKALIELLRDAVDSGASVGFLAPLPTEVAHEYWHGVRDELDSGRVLFCAYRDGTLVGTVQLAPAGKPNARHRAEVQKLLVLQACRGQGIGKNLMRTAEAKALQLGRSLLVLDTRQGDPAETLYTRLGYVKAGVIPDYARAPSGDGLDPTVIFYKRIGV
jgi:GNAT superfamily N-acetyltransferase